MTENLTKAHQTAELLLSDLREALSKATAVESLVLLPMIGDAALLADGIEQFKTARNA
jgi:hypothetical protein